MHGDAAPGFQLSIMLPSLAIRFAAVVLELGIQIGGFKKSFLIFFVSLFKIEIAG